jgi:predicted restriction endonuclease
LDVVNRRQRADFALDEIYAYTRQLSTRFPRNTRIREKIRQTLQRLRDQEGFVRFLGKGRYALNLEHAELQGEPVLLGRKGIESPVTKRVVRNVRMRDTFLAAEIKRRYDHICQVCGVPLVLGQGVHYAECHHLKPIGSPHYGPDVPGNILVLCPNHHVLFDRAVVTIDPNTLRLRHLVEGFFERDARLHLQAWHEVNPKYLGYHHKRFLQNAG